MPELSPRQRDVLELLCTGLSNRLIAQQLVIGEETVKTHVKALLQKYGVTTRYELIVRVHEEGMPPHVGAVAPDAAD